MTIADRIRNRRLELGLSVDDLAKLLNKNRATVYRYESSYIKSYSPDVMESLAKALQTTPAYFYGYDEDSTVSFHDSAPVQPKNDEVRLLIRGLNKLTPAQLEQATNVFRAMFSQTNPDLFEEGDDDR